MTDKTIEEIKNYIKNEAELSYRRLIETGSNHDIGQFNMAVKIGMFAGITKEEIETIKSWNKDGWDYELKRLQKIVEME